MDSIWRSLIIVFLIYVYLPGAVLSAFLATVLFVGLWLRQQAFKGTRLYNNLTEAGYYFDVDWVLREETEKSTKQWSIPEKLLLGVLSCLMSWFLVAKYFMFFYGRITLRNLAVKPERMIEIQYKLGHLDLSQDTKMTKKLVSELKEYTQTIVF